MCVHAREFRNWRESAGFEGSYTQVPAAGHSKYPGLGFGMSKTSSWKDLQSV